MKSNEIINSENSSDTERIIKTEYSEEMKQSFLDYSMSVLVARAVPDVRDGLKPVHRRILYEMEEAGLNHDKAYRKSANVVGGVLGRWHPHGDASVYEAMVNLSHNFSLNTPFVDGHGNFGSIEGDPFASSRYTEAKLEKYTEETLLTDLNKNIVDFMPNYDNTKEEPTVLPAKVPNVLVNGTNGIAVGMTTSTPPHNLKEVLEGYKLYIKNPKCTLKELMSVVQGPDFPTGGIIANKNDLEEIYKTGSGRIRIRGKIEYEPATGKNGKDKLVITEIPYTMIGLGIKKFLQDVAELTKTKVLPEVIDILNQTSSKGIRLVIEVKPNSDIERIKNILYKKTKLEDTFPVNMLYISKGRPETMGLKEIFETFYEFNIEVKTKKYKLLLKNQKEIAEIREGLIKAIDCMDAIIEVLRGSKTVKMAKDCLMGKTISGIDFKTKKSEKISGTFTFTELQAQAILDMKLSRLVNLEINSIIKERDSALSEIKKCEKILSSKKELNKIILADVENIEKNYGRKRRTKIGNIKEIGEIAEKISEINLYVCYDKFGYFKAFDEQTFERNKENITENNKFIFAKNTDNLFIFSNTGSLYQLKINDIPLCKARDRGIPIDNISNFDSNTEQIIYVCSKAEMEKHNVIIVTKNNTIKQTEGKELITSRKLIQFTKLQKEDSVIFSALSTEKYIILFSSGNYALKFKTEDIPMQKRISLGTKAMKLKETEIISDTFLSNGKDKILLGKKQIDAGKLKLSKRGLAGVKI